MQVQLNVSHWFRVHKDTDMFVYSLHSLHSKHTKLFTCSYKRGTWEVSQIWVK